MFKIFNKRNKKAFSLIELIAAIAIMAVLIALLVPSLLRYVESSRAQKDESSCDEVINAIQLAVSSDAIFDEMYEYSCANNFLTYSDSSGVYGSQDSNEEYWAPDGCGRAVTITLNPVNGKYTLDKAIINDMTYGNGSIAESRTISGTTVSNPQCYLKECDNGLLYNRLIETIGNEITLNSQTYRNSSYTIFIRFNGQDNTKIATVYGMFNGTNLTENSLASTGTGTSTYDTNGSANITKTAETTKQSDKKTSALISADVGGSGSLTVSYKDDSSSSDDGFTITTTLTGVKAKAGNDSSIKKDDSKELTFEIEDGFEMPDVITVTGADFTWDKATGKVSLSNATGDVSIEIKAKEDESGKYLCFTAEAATNIRFKKGYTTVTLQYKVDDGEWTNYTLGTDISLISGQKCYFKGDNSNFTTSLTNPTMFISTGKVAASGNIMSLVDSTLSSKTIPNTYCFGKLFYNCTTLTKAPSLPATNLKDYCYDMMFYGCSSLKNVPDLPATTLADYCYYDMFGDCSLLTSAQDVLPAKTLALSCYENMFEGCTSLSSVPELPATTLVKRCYYQMFTNCKALVNAPEMPATTLADYCYYSMFNGCSSLTNVTKLPATTLAEFCYSNMFQYCTSLKTAPEMPATIMKYYCYSGMYYGCSSLTKIPELPAAILYKNCYSNMFANCTSLTTAELPATGLETECYKEIFKGCSNLNKIKLGYTGNFTATYFNGWTKNVASKGDLYYTGSDRTTGVYGIPSGWTVKAEMAHGLYLEDKSLHLAYDDKTYAVGDTYAGSTIAAVQDFNVKTEYSSNVLASIASLATSLVVDESFKNAKPTSMKFWFSGLKNISSVTNINYIDTSNVTSLYATFQDFGSNVSTAFSLDLSSWDVSKVEVMDYIFSNAGYNAGTYSLNISNWDTKNVVTMICAFAATGFNSTSWSITGLSNLNVSKVTTMRNIFYQTGYCSGVIDSANFNISNWDVSNVTDMSGAFYQFGHKAKTFNMDLSKWNVGKVGNMSSMFYATGSNKAETWSLGDLSNWNVSTVANMSYMFAYAGNNAKAGFSLGNLKDWNVSNVQTAASMFYCTAEQASSFNIGDIGNWNFTKVTNLTKMFERTAASASYSLNLTGWTVPKITSLPSNFKAGVESKIISPWD